MELPCVQFDCKALRLTSARAKALQTPRLRYCPVQQSVRYASSVIDILIGFDVVHFQTIERLSTSHVVVA
ncbi:hypothetical protein SP21_52 [Salmonella phage 21]|nr:hypothetical protein SP21_52 [Salmonella phage 21]